jgi:hypothetical protein
MNTRTTLILALCLVAVSLYLVFVAKPWKPEAGPAEAPKAQQLWAEKPAPESIVRVEVESAREPKRVFVKEDDQWRITKPIAAGAQKYQVDDMVRSVLDATAERQYAAGAKDRPSAETTGLAQPAYTVTLVTKDDKRYTVKIGNRTPTGGDTYVERSDSETVFVANKNLHQTFDKRLRTIRDKRVTQYKATDAVRVKVEGASNFELVKADGTWRLESPVRCRAEQSKVNSLLSSVSNFYAQEFVADAPGSLRAYGLAPPRLTVTVTYEVEVKKPEKKKEGEEPETQPAEPEKEEKTLVIQFGGPTDAEATAYFAKLGDEDAVFSVAKSSFTNASPKLADIRDKALVTLDTNRVKKLVGSVGGEAFALTKEDGAGWQYADGTEAEAARVLDLLRAIRDLKAIRFEEDTIAISTGAPRAEMTLTVEGRPEPVTIRVLGKTPSEKNTYVMAGEDTLAVVAEESVADILAAPISYRPRKMLTFRRADANRLEVRQSDRDVVLVRGEKNTWRMVEPIAGQTDKNAVRDVLSDLSVLRAQKVVGRGNPAAFGLDKPDAVVTVTVQPAAKEASDTNAESEADEAPELEAESLEKLRAAWEKNHPGEPLPPDLAAAIEKSAATQPTTATATQAATTQVAGTQPVETQPAPEPIVHRVTLSRRDGNVYAMVDARELVYQVNAKVYDDVTAEMLDRSVTSYKVDDVTALSIIRPKDRVDLAKRSNDWDYVTDPTVDIDEEKVKEILNALRDLKAVRFVEYDAPADALATYKLDAPALQVIATVAMGEAVRLNVSAVGPDAPAGARYATIVGSKRVFVLTSEALKKLNKTLEDLVPSKEDKGAATPPPPPGPRPAPAGFPRPRR